MALAGLVVFRPLATHAEITITSRFTELSSNACVNGGACDPRTAPALTDPLAQHDLTRSSSTSSSRGSSSGSATTSNQVSLNGSTGVLSFSGTTSGNATARVDERPDGAAGTGSSAAQLSGQFSGTIYSFTVSGNISIPQGRAVSGSENRCRVRVSGPEGVVYDELVQGQGSRTLSGSGTLSANQSGTYTIRIDFNTFAEAGSNDPNRPLSDMSQASMNFVVQLTPAAAPTPTPTPPPCEGPQCEEFHWTNPIGGNFSQPANWNRMAVPGPADEAHFDLPFQENAIAVQASNIVDLLSINHLRINLSGSLQSRRLVVTNGANLSLQPGATIALTGFTVIDNAGLQMAGVGTQMESLATVQIFNGAVVLVDAGAVLSSQSTTRGIVLGEEGSPSCTLQVLRAGLVRTPLFIVGVGELSIASGGSVQVDDSCKVFSGSIAVSGEGASSSRLEIGGTLNVGGMFEAEMVPTGQSDLRIEGGGTVRAEDVNLGDRNGMFADTITVSGVGASGQASSLIMGGRLFVGGIAGTQVEVSDGALVSTSASVRIGLVDDIGKVLVRGRTSVDISTLTAFEVLVGSSVVPSELIVQDGGRVTIADRLFLGPNPAEVGRAIVSGSDSSLSAGNLIVGADGDGELKLSDGARVSSAQATVGSNFFTGTGKGLVTIEGTPFSSSEWQVTGNCEVGAGEPGTVKLMGTTIGPFSVGGATLNVTGTLTVNIAGAILGNGTLTAGARVVNDGFISPGLSPGVIAVNGDYEQTSSGKLKIQVGGLGAGQFDGVHVTGNTTLGGALEMTFLNDYVPRSGDTFRFLEVEGSITGGFAEVVFPQLLPGFQFDTAVVPGGLQFTALNDAILKHRALNISTRMRVETGDNVLIGGFILTGNDSKKVILRAIGPSLAAAGLPGFLQDPTLELHDSTGAVIASNDNWRNGGQEAEIIATMIPPTNDLESAIVRTLPVGAYTVIIRGNNGGTGNGLVEAYDLGPTVDSKLANISSRGRVQTGDDVMIGGFILGGGGGGSLRVVVRGIGPSLPVPGKLEDPTLALHDGNGTLIARNDNWRTGGQEAELIATTLAPANDLESAMVKTLAPGPYTAIVRGQNNTTGVALVEVFNIE